MAKNQPKLTEKELKTLVDRLGELKAKVAGANEEIEEIKKKLIVAGIHKASGSLFDVTITTTTSSRVDWNSLKEDYDLPLEKYTQVSESTKMTISARK